MLDAGADSGAGGCRRTAPTCQPQRVGLPPDHPSSPAPCPPHHAAQSGELNTPQRLAYLEDITRAVKERTIALDLEQRSIDAAHVPEDKTGLGLCVALSGALGEERKEQCERC